MIPRHLSNSLVQGQYPYDGANSRMFIIVIDFSIINQIAMDSIFFLFFFLFFFFLLSISSALGL